MAGNPRSIALRSGAREWSEFLRASNLHSLPWHAIALFDLHNVVDQMNFRDAVDVGVDLDHTEWVLPLLCSFGHRYRQGTFDANLSYRPMIMEMHGFIFTDFRVGWNNTIDVYRESWMPPNCIGVKGDKSQVAELLGRPTILFDDDVNNLDRLQARSTARKPMRGVLVESRHRRRWNVGQGGYYATEPNCIRWTNLVERFVADVRLLGWCRIPSQTGDFLSS